MSIIRGILIIYFFDFNMTEQTPYLVQNYMATNPVTINPEATLRQAVDTMVQSNTYALIVVDDDKHVIGIVSITDVIKEIVPDYLESDEHVAAFETAALFAERVRSSADHPISHFMTSRVHTIQPSHTIMEVATRLSEYRLRQLPVVDDHGVLVGYIGRTKVRQAIVDALSTSSA